ncbi:hypothetical protein ABZ086_30135, partial [Streptomyces halstedii]
RVAFGQLGPLAPVAGFGTGTVTLLGLLPPLCAVTVTVAVPAPRRTAGVPVDAYPDPDLAPDGPRPGRPRTWTGRSSPGRPVGAGAPDTAPASTTTARGCQGGRCRADRAA